MRPDPETGGPRLWTGQDGVVRASYEITADSVQFLSTREEAAQISGSMGDDFDQSPVEEEDDIPF
jgi:single-strand DNA-binding protein